MTTLRLAALLLAMLLAATASFGQSPKPRAGAPDDPVPSCPVIEGPFRFCGTAPSFALTPQSDNPAVTAYYATPEGIQAIAIVEQLGTRDGLTIPGIQNAALRILSQTTGQPVEALPILGRGSAAIAGVAQPNIVYSGVIDGTPIVYSNSIVLLDDRVSQFVTLESGVTTYSPRHRNLHMQFLSQIQVTP